MADYVNGSQYSYYGNQYVNVNQNG